MVASRDGHVVLPCWLENSFFQAKNKVFRICKICLILHNMVYMHNIQNMHTPHREGVYILYTPSAAEIVLL